MEFPPAIVHEVIIDHQYVSSKHLAEMSPEELDKDWKLDEFFGSVYVINLPQAQQRLQAITANLHSVGMKTFQVFRAVDGRKELEPTIWRKFWKNWQLLPLNTPEGRAAFDNQRKGEAGCFMSRYRLISMVKKQFDEAMQQLKEARDNGDKKKAALAAKTARQYSSVLILEDDNGFGIVKSNDSISQAVCGFILRQALQELPNDWDMLYFTLLTRDPIHPFSSHLCLITQTYGTHAYAVNYKMYGALVKFLRRIEHPAVRRLLALDKELAGVYPGHRIFALVPSLAYQCKGLSFITDKKKNHPSQTLP